MYGKAWESSHANVLIRCELYKVNMRKYTSTKHTYSHKSFLIFLIDNEIDIQVLGNSILRIHEGSLC